MIDEGVNSTGLSGALQTIEMVGVAGGQPDALFFNSGYSDLPHRGVEVGTLLENFVIPAGWQLVDAGKLLEVRVHDHVILGDGDGAGWVSMATRGEL